MQALRAALFGVTLAALAAGGASASSPDAWLDFQKTVGDKCRKAVISETGLKRWTVAISDIGSESYGVAILTGSAKGGPSYRYVCIMDKQTTNVELAGGEASGWINR